MLQIRFTGQGRDYFWLWANNLLRLVATLGLYHPFAQARRRHYIQTHTLVDGHALGYHGGQRPALQALAAVLALACSAVLVLAVVLATRGGAGKGIGIGIGIGIDIDIDIDIDINTSLRPTAAGAVVGVLLVTLWPALWHATLCDRLASTSWRGMRLRFTGDRAGAYRALLPQWLPAALLLVLSSVPTPHTQPAAAAVRGVFGLTGLAMVLMLPLTLARTKRYQHGHCQCAAEHSRMPAPTHAFYRLVLGVVLAGVGLLGLLLVLLALVGTTDLARLGLHGGLADAVPAAAGGGLANTVGVLGCGSLLLGAVLVAVRAFGLASLQNLVWGHTRSSRMRLDSHLNPWRLVAMALRHAGLMLLTLGFYWPFAVMHSTRLRLQAMQVVVRGDPAHWLSGPALLVPDSRRAGVDAAAAAEDNNSAH